LPEDFVAANGLLAHWLVETNRSNFCDWSLSFTSYLFLAIFPSTKNPATLCHPVG
jgi:hypothetical protein